MVYDGATTAAAAARGLAALAGSSPDLVLLFSDGMTTIGGEPSSAPGLPVWCVSAARVVNTAALRSISERSGAGFLWLGGETPEGAAARIGEPPVVLADVRATGGGIDIAAATPRVLAGEELLAGRISGQAGEVIARMAVALEAQAAAPPCPSSARERAQA